MKMQNIKNPYCEKEMVPVMDHNYINFVGNFWLRASCFRVRYKKASNKFSSYFLQYFQFFTFLKWNFYNEKLPLYVSFSK